MVFGFFKMFILLSLTLTETHSTCHMCQSNFAACHDEKHFTMCTEGISVDEIRTCPDGYICTGETEICLQRSNQVQPTCEEACDLCTSPDKLFACLDEKTYVFCFGTDVPDYSAKGICPDGFVCNLSQRQVCTPASDFYPSCYNGVIHAPTTLPPSTTSSGTDDIPITSSETTEPVTITTDAVTSPPTSTPTSTTTNDPTTLATTLSTNSPQDETAFCAAKQQVGFHKAENDPTCRKYILCYILSGQYLGIKYTCSSTEYYNEDTTSCQAERPVNC